MHIPKTTGKKNSTLTLLGTGNWCIYGVKIAVAASCRW